MKRKAVLACLICIVCLSCTSRAPKSTSYELRKVNDSLYFLNDWELPYPVYRFATGDVDGDGNEDALVGVVKRTRFHSEMGRRLFIFKQKGGKVRPLWLGSSLGGTLVDFRLDGNKIRSLEQTGPNKYMVAEYGWRDFCPEFRRYIVEDTDLTNANKIFNL
ncbi:MAG: hypothetical protein J6Z14_06615 [Prevotella sp.]|nr:hypothetical protein [Prevotella sp.]